MKLRDRRPPGTRPPRRRSRRARGARRSGRRWRGVHPACAHLLRGHCRPSGGGRRRLLGRRPGRPEEEARREEEKGAKGSGCPDHALNAVASPCAAGPSPSVKGSRQGRIIRVAGDPARGRYGSLFRGRAGSQRSLPPWPGAVSPRRAAARRAEGDPSATEATLEGQCEDPVPRPGEGGVVGEFRVLGMHRVTRIPAVVFHGPSIE